MPRLLADVAQLLDDAFPLYAVIGRDGVVVRVSPQLRETLGLQPGERWLAGLSWIGHPPGDLRRPEQAMGQALHLSPRGRPSVRYQGQILPAGSALWALVLIPEMDGEDLPAFVPHACWVDRVAFERDERERTQRALGEANQRIEELERALARARRRGVSPTADLPEASRQRLEVLGQLAGSITHDFNNLLVAILGHASHGLEDCAEPQAREALLGVQDAAERAAALTARLLSLGGPTADQGPVDASSEVKQIAGLIRRLLRDSVQLEIDIQVQPAWIPIDRTRLEQILVNLAINARDAMPQGGRLYLGVTKRMVGPALAASLGLQHGVAACLVIRDSGTGMTTAVASRVFEPFYTTKGPGQGTGLGLSTVRKVVEEVGGGVQLASRPGRGTTFSLWFPLAATPRMSLSRAALGRAPAAEGATVLLVDDEPQVRSVVARMLQKGGWTVVQAHDVPDALARVPPASELSLVITDQNMPGGTGVQLLSQLRTVRPGVPCIVMSGYSDDVELRDGALRGDFRLLPKPFNAQRLQEAVHRSVAKARLARLDDEADEPHTMPSWMGKAS